MNKSEASDSPLCISAYSAVTPLGNSTDELSYFLKNKVSGFSEINKFYIEDYQCKFAGIPKKYNVNLGWPTKNECISYELLYAGDAANQLKCKINIFDHYSPHEVGCILGVEQPILDVNICKAIHDNLSGEVTKESVFTAAIDSFDTEFFRANSPGGLINEVKKHIPFSAFAISLPGVCAASLQSMSMAIESIGSGKAKAVICGGISAKVTPFDLALFEGMGVVSTDERFSADEISRPFDQDRGGFALSEGAVLFLIEKESDVLKRGDIPLLRICGHGFSMSAQHIVTPHTDEIEMTSAMLAALECSKLNPEDIDVVSAHGTSTQQNDLHEANAIARVFKEHKPYVTATKSNHGHMMAAAGAMEVLCIISYLKHGYIPGIVNLNNVDNNIPDINLVKHTREFRPRYILKNSFGMGGVASSVIFESYSY
ncbi:beta-ketoacyl-[acyl-carrier-protein] synthase family protein [Morganella morganii]|uniref:beta-ketoacyl-[acyl-carrier-protein] synthase family protein n=1 Tax=Morganella morganii TaxID=582 RepID=UPI0023676552|nr:beta-ketoacyl-[acyl-carrier-protein] synthase family protein [Morganella morganii]